MKYLSYYDELNDDEVLQGLEDRTKRAIKDIASDGKALDTVLTCVDYLLEGNLSEEDFIKMYNKWRSQRGVLNYGTE